MTDTVVIPELHLFSSRRCTHHSPTRDLGYDSYKNTKKTIQYYDRLSVAEQKIAALRQNKRLLAPPPILRQPIPVPVPMPVMSIPIPQYPLDVYDVPCGPMYYPEIDRQFIRAPSTYLEYAEEYLMGRRAPIIPQTARFKRTSPNNSRRAQPSRPQNHIARDIYLKKEQPKHQQPKPKPPPKQPYIAPPKQPYIAPPKQPYIAPPKQPQIKKDPYIVIDTKRQSPKRPVINEGTQTQGGENQPSPQGQKFTKIVTTTTVTDSKNLRTYLNGKVSEFNNIHIQFDDLTNIDLDQLYEAKQKYMEGSREILLKLNELAGDASGLTLAYKMIQSQTKKEMHWPDI